MFVLVSLIFVVVGLGLTALGFWFSWRGWRSRSWPSTPGKVLKSWVERTHHHRRDQDGRTSTSTSEQPRIVYAYKVEGRRYEADRYRFGGQSSSVGLISLFTGTKARKIVEAHPVGKKVRVYYDPDKPKAATLVTGVSVGAILFLVFGVLLTLMGTVFAILGATNG